LTLLRLNREALCYPLQQTPSVVDLWGQRAVLERDVAQRTDPSYSILTIHLVLSPRASKTCIWPLRSQAALQRQLPQARPANYPSFLAFMHYQDSGDDLGNIEAAMTDQQSAF